MLAIAVELGGSLFIFFNRLAWRAAGALIPVAGTAGRAGRYTGTYGQFRVDCALTPHVAPDLEAVHFAVGEVHSSRRRT